MVVQFAAMKKDLQDRLAAPARERTRAKVRTGKVQTSGARKVAQIAVLDRAARLLLALGHSAETTTLNDAARRSGLSKATAFRILATLMGEGFVLQDAATSSYRLGVAPLKLATSVLDGFAVHAAARQVMRAVCDELNETVVLSVEDGDTRVNIHAVECTNAIGSSHRIGEPRPLYASAASRILLAAKPDDWINSYLKRVKASQPSAFKLIDLKALWRDIRRVRQTGFASTAGEISPQAHAFAAAIKDGDGRTIAALHVAIPKGRFTRRIEARCGEVLQRAVASITGGLTATHVKRGKI